MYTYRNDTLDLATIHNRGVFRFPTLALIKNQIPERHYHFLGLSLTTRVTRRDSPCLVSKLIDIKTASYFIVCSIFNSECTCMWCSYLWTLWLLIDAQYSFYYQVYVFIIIICVFKPLYLQCVYLCCSSHSCFYLSSHYILLYYVQSLDCKINIIII